MSDQQRNSSFIPFNTNLHRRIFALFLLATIWVGNSFADAEAGWNALFNNDPIAAEAAFMEVPEDSPDRSTAMDGLVLARWMLGDVQGMYNGWSELLQSGGEEAAPTQPWWPGYLKALKLKNLRGHDPEETLELLNIILNLRHITDEHRHAVLEEIAEQEENHGEIDKLEEHLKELGVIRDWWYIAGPFGLSGQGDLKVEFPPETDLWQSSWPSWLGTVHPKPHIIDQPGPVPVDRTGWLNFYDLTSPEGSTAYAVTVLEGTRIGTARLIVESACDVRVWWDGYGVLERDSSQQDYSRRLETMVPIRRGPILLVIKATQATDWRVRVRLDDPKGLEAPWTIADRSQTATANMIISPFGFTPPSIAAANDATQENASAPAETLSPTIAVENLPHGKILDSLYARIAAAKYSQIKEAHTHLANLRQACMEAGAGNWALLDLLEANQLMFEARLRPQSRTRLQQEALQAYQNALERCPLLASAATGLANYYLERDQLDQALEVTETFIDETWKPTGRPIPPFVTEMYGQLQMKKNWHLRARSSMITAHESGWPQLPSLYLELANHAEQSGRSSEALGWITEGLRHFPDSDQLIDRVFSLPPGTLETNKSARKALRDTIDANVKMHPASFRWRRRACHLERADGELDKALEIMQQTVADLPHIEEAKESLAALLAYTEPANAEAAEKAYKEALQAAPWDLSLQKTVDAMETIRGVETQPFYKPYDIRFEDLDLSAAEKWNNTRAGSVFLIDLMVLDLMPSGAYRAYIHQAVRILNEEGRRDWAEYVIPSGVELIEARTINPDGKIWPVDHIKSLSGQQALSFFEVQEGTIVEYAYAQTVNWNRSPGRNYYAGRFFFGAFEQPMLVSKLVLLSPPDLEPRIDWTDESIEPLRNEDGSLPVSEGKTVRIWEAKEQDGIKRESFTPPIQRLVPSVSITTAKSWLPQIQDVLASLDQIREPGPWIADLLNEIGLDADGADRQRVAKLVNWVRDEIEEGSGSGTAHDAAVLRTGAAHAKISLLEALLQEAKYEVYPVMILPLSAVQAGTGGDGFAPMPSGKIGTVSLLRVTLPDEDWKVIYVDPTARYAKPFYLLPEYRTRLALVLDPRGYYVEPIDSDLWQGGWTENRHYVRLNPDCSSSISGSVDFMGIFKPLVIRLSKNSEAEDRFVRQSVSSAFRGLAVENAVLEGVDDVMGQPSITFRGALPNHQRTTGSDTNGLAIREIDLDPNPVELSNAIREVTRTSPVVIESPLTHNPSEITYDLSALLEEGKWRPELPEDVFIMDRFGIFTLTSRLEGSTVHVRRSMLIPPQSIEKEKYGDFAEFCRKVDEGERLKLKLRPLQDTL